MLLLTPLSDNWVTVPTNSTLTIHKQTVMIHPIIDEFYNHNPHSTRNSQFAQDRGLVSSAPGEAEAQGSTAAAGAQLADMDAIRKKLAEVQMSSNL